MNSIIIGTRGSELALAQARMTLDLLRDSGFDGGLEERIIQTSGDLRQDIKLSDFSKGDSPVAEKGVFTKELEDALLSGEIDAAVHSLKDLPSQLAGEFKLAAVLPRAAVEDILLVRGAACSLSEFAPGAVIATSSVRRARTVAWKRPDLELCDIRGNVPTRLGKLADGRAGDATILARAGLERLGFYREGCNEIEIEGSLLGCRVLPAGEFIPAGGQGAVGIETLSGSPVADRFQAINDAETFLRVSAERKFLYLLGAGCDTPVGVCADLDTASGEISLQAVVFDESDAAAPPKTGTVSAPCGNEEEMARELLQKMGIGIDLR